jgi:hypothetical protein
MDFALNKQVERLIEVIALSALMGETKQLDERHRIRARLKLHAFPEEIPL